MLYKDPFIVATPTFELIQQLQSIPEINNFQLVGGTALALQIGHRNSIDIDLFTQDDFDSESITSVVKNSFNYNEIYRRGNTIIGLINDIKVDFIKHDYPFINPPIIEEGIKYLSKEDIAGMKVHAIIQSGKRLKDFIDIYFLLQYFSLGEMIDFFTKKYTYSNPLIALKALTYFDDIDENIDPPKLLQPIPFSEIKERILDASLHSKKKFS
jgi:hypothetical protein